jgi:hypothetical protein
VILSTVYDHHFIVENGIVGNHCLYFLYISHHTVSVFASSAVDREFERRSGQTKDYKMVVVASPVSTQH